MPIGTSPQGKNFNNLVCSEAQCGVYDENLISRGAPTVFQEMNSNPREKHESNYFSTNI